MDDSLASVPVPISSRPGTSNALVLLRIIRFRNAFLSPAAGGLAVDCCTPFFLIRSTVTPFLGGPEVDVFFFAGAGSAFGAVVEKGCVWSHCGLLMADASLPKEHKWRFGRGGIVKDTIHVFGDEFDAEMETAMKSLGD